MKRTIVAVSLLLIAGMAVGCNKGKDHVDSQEVKVFGEHTLANGTRKVERREFSSGEKDFDVAYLPDGTIKIGRAEYPNGEKQYYVTQLPDGTENMDVEFPNGEKDFDVTLLKDKTAKIERIEFPDGRQQFNVTRLPDGTIQIARATGDAASEQAFRDRLSDCGGGLKANSSVSAEDAERFLTNCSYGFTVGPTCGITCKEKPIDVHIVP